MWQLVRTPKTQLGITLFLIFLTAFINNPSLKIIAIYLFLHFIALVSDLIFLKIRGITFLFPSAALVSASIITLVVNPNLSWYQLFVIAVLAIASKNFLRISDRHIFNPAGFGLFVGSLIFPNAISWWGTSFQQFYIFHFPFSIYFLVLLSPLLISMVRMRRHRIILSFLVTYVLLQTILNSEFSILNSIFDPTLLFFSLVMLPEPMTTPNRRFQQIMFGVITAFLSILISLPFSNFEFRISNFETDPLITSLLIGNLIFFKLK